jgi:hypothetical protein
MVDSTEGELPKEEVSEKIIEEKNKRDAFLGIDAI